MLAYYVEFHMRQAWKGLLYHDEEESQRQTPISPAEPSPSAKTQKGTARSENGFPLQTFRDLLKTLAALSRAPTQLGEEGPTFLRSRLSRKLVSRPIPWGDDHTRGQQMIVTSTDLLSG